MTSFQWQSDYLESAYPRLIHALGTAAMGDAVQEFFNPILRINALNAVYVSQSGVPVRMMLSASAVKSEHASETSKLRSFEGVVEAAIISQSNATHDFKVSGESGKGGRARILLLQPQEAGYIALGLLRTQTTLAFTQDDVFAAASLAKLVFPLIKKNAMLTSSDARVATGKCELIESYLVELCGRLTHRERAVCARTLTGMTANGIGIDLGISPTTVVTYRRRAYERLNVSGAYELFGILLSRGSS
jgi:DNA-binding CsgD family transcriptional regulator